MCCKEILETVDILKESKKAYEAAYRHSKEAQKCVRGAKGYFKDVANEYKKILDELEFKINGLNNKLLENSTFPYKMLVDFLVKVLSFHEHSEVTSTELVLTNYFTMGLNSYVNYDVQYLIYYSKLKDQINELENRFIIRHLKQFYKETLGDYKYIIDDVKPSVSLLDENGLRKEFECFPYLENIAYSLIDRRLREPEKDLQLILDEELESIVCVGSKKIKTNEEV